MMTSPVDPAAAPTRGLPGCVAPSLGYRVALQQAINDRDWDSCELLSRESLAGRLALAKQCGGSEDQKGDVQNPQVKSDLDLLARVIEAGLSGGPDGLYEQAYRAEGMVTCSDGRVRKRAEAEQFEQQKRAMHLADYKSFAARAQNDPRWKPIKSPVDPSKKV